LRNVWRTQILKPVIFIYMTKLRKQYEPQKKVLRWGKLETIEWENNDIYIYIPWVHTSNGAYNPWLLYYYACLHNIVKLVKMAYIYIVHVLYVPYVGKDIKATCACRVSAGGSGRSYSPQLSARWGPPSLITQVLRPIPSNLSCPYFFYRNDLSLRIEISAHLRYHLKRINQFVASL
jgi:hypothetical protein